MPPLPTAQAEAGRDPGSPEIVGENDGAATVAAIDEVAHGPVPAAPAGEQASRPKVVRFLSAYVRNRWFGWTIFVSLIVIWQLYATANRTPGLPPPAAILETWYTELRYGKLLPELTETLITMGQAYVLAATIGITLGVLMARSRVVWAIFEPFVELLRPVPAVVMIPVIIVYVGIGREMIMLVILLAAVNPVLLNTYAGARAIPSTLRDTAATYRLSWFQTLREVVLPTAGPHIVVGLRLALAVCLVVAVAAGMIAGNSGIGFYILHAQQTLNVTAMYAGALTVALIGYGLNWIYLLIENRILHWHIAVERRST